MVVCLILKVNQPLLLHTVNFHGHHDGAGIDFIGNLHIRKFSIPAQLLHCHQGQVHQADVLIVPPLIYHFPVSQVLLICILNGFPVIPVRKAYILKFSGKRGVAAVVGPVCIQHTDFRYGRIPALFLFIICLDMEEILKSHGQVQGIIKSL